MFPRSKLWPPWICCASCVPGSENSRGERGGPDDAAAFERASARPVRPRFRCDLHRGQAHRVRLPRLSVADPPADLSPHQSRQSARARIQGGRHHHHALRHDRAERSGPLPPGGRRDRPRAAAARRGRHPKAGAARPSDRAQALHIALRRRHAGNPRLEVAGGK